MRRAILLLAALAGCRAGAHAGGSVVLEPEALKGAISPAQIDAVLASEAEILGARQATVKRRGASLILDVEVGDADPLRAQSKCNELLQKYLDRRREQIVVRIQTQMQVLGDQLERTHDEALRQKLKDLDVERAMMRSDARLLEPCRLTSASRERAGQSADR